MVRKSKIFRLGNQIDNLTRIIKSQSLFINSLEDSLELTNRFVDKLYNKLEDLLDEEESK